MVLPVAETMFQNYFPISLIPVTVAAVSFAALNMVPQSTFAAPGQAGSRDLPSVAAASAVADTVPVAPAEPPPEKAVPDKSSDNGFATEDFIAPDSKKSAPRSAVIPEKANVRVELAVPQLADAVDKFVAYPYAMPIPTRKPGPVADMPSTKTGIKNTLLQTCYAVRNTDSRAYPTGGWRWKMAYKNALKRSGADEPHVITDLYPFLNRMEPYMLAECKRFDKLEEERTKRVQRATEEYELNRADAENVATRKGYFPIEFRFLRGVRGRGAHTAAELKLPEGTWYITGTHKVPGLRYYWQEPVHVSEGEMQTIELTMENALVIEGGW